MVSAEIASSTFNASNLVAMAALSDWRIGEAVTTTSSMPDDSALTGPQSASNALARRPLRTTSMLFFSVFVRRKTYSGMLRVEESNPIVV